MWTPATVRTCSVGLQSHLKMWMNVFSRYFLAEAMVSICHPDFTWHYSEVRVQSPGLRGVLLACKGVTELLPHQLFAPWSTVLVGRFSRCRSTGEHSSQTWAAFTGAYGIFKVLSLVSEKPVQSTAVLLALILLLYPLSGNPLCKPKICLDPFRKRKGRSKVFPTSWSQMYL